MEAFTVQCTTCQSKLRVRDPNLIHQIVSCPKCNSMIQIEPPGQISVQPPGQYNVDSTAVTREVDYQNTDAAAPDAAPFENAGAAEDQPTLDNIDWSGDEFRLAPLDDEPNMAGGVQPSWQPVEAPPLTPGDEWTSPKAAQSKQYLLIGFVGLAGILAAALLFFFFLRWINDRPTTELANANPPSVAADESGDPTAADEPKADGGADDVSSDELAPNGDDVGSELVPPLQDDGDSPMTPTPEAGDETLSGEPTLNGDAVDPPANTIDQATTDGTSENNTLDPSDAAAGDGATNNKVAEGGSTLPKQLQDFQQLLIYQVVPTLVDTQVLPTEAPMTAEELGFDVSATSAASPAIDFGALSKAEMPAMVFRERSLSSVVNLWTHLSGIPTIVDLQALAAAGIDADKPVNLKVTAQAALPLGRSIASAVGCKLVEQDTSHLLITPPVSAIQAHLPASLELEKLAGDEATREWLDGAVAELLPELAGLTKWQGTELQFVADEQTEQSGWLAWYRLVKLLDNWNQAVQGSSLPELKSPMPRQSLVDPFNLAALDKQMDFVIAESLPSGQLLTRCADRVGMQCWIDWASVGEGGLHPGSRFASVTYHREFRRILADYAAEYMLVVAVLDEQSLWLASPQRYRAETRLYVVASEGRTVEQWQQQLRPLTPVAADGSSLLRIVATPDAQWVFVRCCPPAVR